MMGMGLRFLVLMCSMVRGSHSEIQGSPCSSPPGPESSFLPPVSCSRDHISQALRGTAACMARDKVIPVPWPTNSSVDQLTPSHVTVRRCSGGCQRLAQHCVPTGTHKRKIPVLLGRCPLGGGKCHKECATLEVEDHISCSCGCRLGEQSCSSEQQFDTDTCSCTCRDRSAMTSCLETGRSWDASSCSCLCPPSKTCSGGRVLDPSTCGCLLKEIQEGQEQEAEEREERSEGQEDPLLLKWEYMVILTLASLNLLLVSIVVVLARRHHNLRIGIKNQPSHLPSTLAGNLYSPCPGKEAEGEKGATTGGSIQLYSSGSDISSEQQNTDSSYCSYTRGSRGARVLQLLQPSSYIWGLNFLQSSSYPCPLPPQHPPAPQ